MQFAHLMKSIPRASYQTIPSSGGAKAAKNPELEMHQMIHGHGMVETFANVEIVLWLYLCMSVTNCTGKRSFSKMKLIKNETGSRSPCMRPRSDPPNFGPIERGEKQTNNID